MQLLPNNFATHTKKCYVNKIDKNIDKAPKININQEKIVSMKCVRKIFSKS